MTEETKLGIFKEVPNFDPRTLVLKYGDKLLDLGFCSCPNKYKKRFSVLLADHPELYEDVKNYALALVKQGYEQFDVKEILDALRVEAKIKTSSLEYFTKYAHDFNLEVIYRQYLVRKLMMEVPELFNFFSIGPIKCKANCGFPENAPKIEDTASLAGI